MDMRESVRVRVRVRVRVGVTPQTRHLRMGAFGLNGFGLRLEMSVRVTIRDDVGVQQFGLKY